MGDGSTGRGPDPHLLRSRLKWISYSIVLVSLGLIRDPQGAPARKSNESVRDSARGHSSLTLVGIVGAGEAEVPVLAELHRNRRVHIIGIYDLEPTAVGLELAEILGLRHGSSREFLEQIASAQQVVLPRDRHRYAEAIQYLRDRGVSFLNQNEAIALYAVDGVVDETPRATPSEETAQRVSNLEEAMGWLNRALDREELLRALLSIAIQSVEASKGSIQLLDPLTHELYIAYAEGLSDHTVRTSRQKLGEGIAGEVAASRRGRLLRGGELSPSYRERPDILSAICVPLAVGDRVLGVLNVSTDRGGHPLTPANLEVLSRVSSQVSPVLARLLEIQTLHERALVEDLRREMDRLLQMDLGLEERLALSRDLLQDLSSAHSSSLVVLTPDGPAFRVLPGRSSDGSARTGRDVDPTQGILGQVLLGTEPVIMEEKIRPAGHERIQRHLTLYLTFGEPEVFAVFVGHFEGLALLSHFQRNMDRVVEVMTPRLGALISQEETRDRMGRLTRLASAMGVLTAQPHDERARTAASILQEQSEAETVAVWLGDEAEPAALVHTGELAREVLAPLWPRIRARLRQGGAPQRVREVDLEGSRLRSLLLAGDPGGPALAAFNRAPGGPLEELGFREEDVEATLTLLDALRAPRDSGGHAGQSDSPIPEAVPPDLYETNRTLLRQSVEHELRRAQRYHFGFSLTYFELVVADEAWPELEPVVRRRIETSSRSTDGILWVAPRRFAVLAPEEARGQRRLARRFQDLLLDAMSPHPAPGAQVRVGHASYPHDAETADELLATCRRLLEAPAD